MKYNDIREKYQNIPSTATIVDKYATKISPMLTKVFIKTKLTPNEITILMIISGLIGGGLFFINNIYFRILGLIFIHLWYILDCCDGEVARIKKKFSSFGKELDFSAHILNHPIYNIAFAMALISTNKYNSLYVTIMFIALLSLDMLGRNLLSFDIIYKMKYPSENQGHENKKTSSLKLFVGKVMSFFADYPNFALIFPIIYVFDYITKWNLSIIYLSIQVLAVALIILRQYVRWITKIKDL